jgi:hypothetical protein
MPRTKVLGVFGVNARSRSGVPAGVRRVALLEDEEEAFEDVREGTVGSSDDEVGGDVVGIDVDVGVLERNFLSSGAGGAEEMLSFFACRRTARLECWDALGFIISRLSDVRDLGTRMLSCFDRRDLVLLRAVEPERNSSSSRLEAFVRAVRQL